MSNERPARDSGSSGRSTSDRSGGRPPSTSAGKGAPSRSGSGRPPGKPSGTDKPRTDKPRTGTDKPRTDKPRSGSGRPPGKPSDSDRPRSDRPRSDKPRSDKPRSDKPRSDKPRSDRPRSDKPRSGSDRSDGRRTAARTGDARGSDSRGRDPRRPDTRRPDRNGADRPRDPVVADDITADQLDKGVGHELRTLPEGLAEIVARHLVAADQALVNDNVPLARQHIAAAKRRAGRVAAVREAAGITAYLAGDYAEAISELRTVRRMTGSNEYLPMMADCERGLGRPQKALELVKEVDARTLDPATRVELLLVSAGARADLGQLEAALVVLQVPELRQLPPGGPRARMQYAYADLLERVGRFEDAHEWMRLAAESDVDGVTDAAERLEEEAGVAFSEEDFDDDVPLDGEGNRQP